MEANWHETGFDFRLNPSEQMYRSAVDTGLMFVLAAFDGDNIVGYCTMVVHPHMHNPDVIVAANDALFVKREYRGMTGARLIRMAERESARRGASRVLWHTRTGTRLHDTFVKRGYKPIDTVVMKEIRYGD